MLVAGFFRLVDDLPKPVWRYPLSYIGFDMYALQVQKKSSSSQPTASQKSSSSRYSILNARALPHEFVVEQIFHA
jgi:hypothetical protein